MEVSIDNSVHVSIQGNTSSGETLSSKPKKAKLAAELTTADNSLSVQISRYASQAAIKIKSGKPG
jgi:hypothetical protein